MDSILTKHDEALSDEAQVKECAMTKMTKTMTAIAAAATLAVAAVAAPQPAEARGWHHGGGVAAGVIGGLAAGAILGGIAANGPYGYYGPAYYGPGPYYGPGCYWTRQRVEDGWGWHWRRVRICG
jgi:hypothetical protein